MTSAYAYGACSADGATAVLAKQLAGLLLDDALSNTNKMPPPSDWAEKTARRPTSENTDTGAAIEKRCATHIARQPSKTTAPTILFPSTPLFPCLEAFPSVSVSLTNTRKCSLPSTPYAPHGASPLHDARLALLATTTTTLRGSTANATPLRLPTPALPGEQTERKKEDDATTAFPASPLLHPIAQHEKVALRKMQDWLQQHHHCLPTVSSVSHALPATAAARAITAAEKALCGAAAVVLRTTNNPRAALLAIRFLVAVALHFRLSVLLGCPSVASTFGISSDDCERVAAIVAASSAAANAKSVNCFRWSAEVLALMQALLTAKHATSPTQQQQLLHLTSNEGVVARLVALTSDAWRREKVAVQGQRMLMAEATQSKTQQRRFLSRLLSFATEALRMQRNSTATTAPGAASASSSLPSVLSLLCETTTTSAFFFETLNAAVEELTAAAAAAATGETFRESDATGGVAAELPLPTLVKDCVTFLTVALRSVACRNQCEEKKFIAGLLEQNTVASLVSLASTLQAKPAVATHLAGDETLLASLLELLTLAMTSAARLGLCRSWLGGSNSSSSSSSLMHTTLTAANAATTISTTCLSSSASSRATTASGSSFLSLCAVSLADGLAIVAGSLAREGQQEQTAQHPAVSAAGSGETSGSASLRSLSSSSCSAPLSLAQLRRSAGPVASLRRKYESLTANLFACADKGIEATQRAGTVAQLVQQVLQLSSLLRLLVDDKDKMLLVHALFTSGVATQLITLLAVLTMASPARAQQSTEDELLTKLRHLTSKDLKSVVDSFTGASSAAPSAFELLCGLVLAERAVVALLHDMMLFSPSFVAKAMMGQPTNSRNCRHASHPHASLPSGCVETDACTILVRYIAQCLPAYLAESLASDGVDALEHAVATLTALCVEESTQHQQQQEGMKEQTTATPFRGRKCIAQVISDTGLLASLADVLTTPMMSAVCKDVPLRTLDLFEVVLTAPHLTSVCRHNLLQHTPKLLPAILSAVDGSGWVLTASPAHHTEVDGALPRPTSTVCRNTGYVRSNNNVHLASLNSSSGSGTTPEALQLPMSAIECDAKSQQYAQHRQVLQIRALHLLTRWTNAPTLSLANTPDFSACDFPIGSHPSSSTASLSALPPHTQQQPTLPHAARTSRIRRYGGSSSSTSSSTMSALQTPVTSRTATFGLPTAGSELSQGRATSVSSPATTSLDLTAPLAESSAFLTFIRGVLDRDGVRELLDISPTDCSTECVAADAEDEEVEKDGEEQKPLDTPMELTGQDAPSHNSKSQLREESSSSSATAAALGDASAVSVRPLAATDKRHHPLRLLREVLIFLHSLVSSPSFTFKNAWLGLCVKVSTTLSTLLSRREANEKRLSESLRIRRQLRRSTAEPTTMDDARRRKELALAEKTATLAVIEAEVLEQFLATAMRYVTRIDVDVLAHEAREEILSVQQVLSPQQPLHALPRSVTAVSTITTTTATVLDEQQQRQERGDVKGIQHCLLDILAQNISAAAVDAALQSYESPSSRLLRAAHRATIAESMTRDQGSPRCAQRPCAAPAEWAFCQWAAPVSLTSTAPYISAMSTLLKKIKLGSELDVLGSE